MQRSVRYILLRQVDKQERNGDYPPFVQSMGWNSKNDDKIYVVHVYQYK